MHLIKQLFWILPAILISMYCTSPSSQQQPEQPPADQQEAAQAKHVVIFDTDANNELDDQHALAYLLLNGNDFIVKGVTVNATKSGGAIENHVKEAERILKLCQLDGKIPLLKGANGNFEAIKGQIDQPGFDGHEAVNFIISQAMVAGEQKLILIPVGKLTNIALALLKEPAIAEKVRIVWLGSNYPAPGEYNQDNDVPSMNYVLSTNAPFEMVTVRYGDPTGTDAVKVTQSEINTTMPGRGPKIDTPIEGRHGGQYQTFGDYSVSLFEHIDYYNEAKERALFDLAAVAIVKNKDWAQARTHPCPVYKDNQWIEQPDNPRKITIWENFDKEKIIGDLYKTLDNYKLVASE